MSRYGNPNNENISKKKVYKNEYLTNWNILVVKGK